MSRSSNLQSGRATLRSLPIEVGFDAGVLEPIAVEPGKAFEAAGFAYRVIPGGSILVGSSGRPAEPVKAAPDSELLVLVFRAIRP